MSTALFTTHKRHKDGGRLLVGLVILVRVVFFALPLLQPLRRASDDGHYLGGADSGQHPVVPATGLTRAKVIANSVYDKTGRRCNNNKKQKIPSKHPVQYMIEELELLQRWNKLNNRHTTDYSYHASVAQNIPQV